ncbi:hypothetical protein SAMN02745866_00898 [Alteromonadaceae bacterium Bs31]|nr:hypothetical protein SAMN02745866_00898 [Alteromonadaceae bacterium Bs31]
MKIILVLLTLILVLPAYAQIIKPVNPSIRPPFKWRFVETIDYRNAHFAFYKTGSDGTTHVYHSRITDKNPPVKAASPHIVESFPPRDHSTGNFDEFMGIDVSPNNDILIITTVEEAPTFIDRYIRFYNLHDGSYITLINEHRFDSLNKHTHSSSSFAAYVQRELDMGVYPEFIDKYDYAVDAEDSPMLISYVWNTDDTISITYNLTVRGRYDDDDMGVIGSDNFTINFTIPTTLNSTAVIESYEGSGKTRAYTSLNYSLSKTLGSNSYATLNGHEISFFDWRLEYDIFTGFISLEPSYQPRSIEGVEGIEGKIKRWLLVRH